MPPSLHGCKRPLGKCISGRGLPRSHIRAGCRLTYTFRKKNPRQRLILTHNCPDPAYVRGKEGCACRFQGWNPRSCYGKRAHPEMWVRMRQRRGRSGRKSRGWILTGVHRLATCCSVARERRNGGLRSQKRELSVGDAIQIPHDDHGGRDVERGFEYRHFFAVERTNHISNH